MVKIKDVIFEYSVRNRSNEDIPVYSVTNEKGFCTDYFSKEVASKDKTTYKIVPRGYFAYNPSRINVGSIDWQNHEDRVIVSPLYVVFGVSEYVDQQYLFHYLKSDMMLTLIKEYATGSVRDNLKLSILEEFPLNLRPINEQRKIAAVLDKVSDLIAKRRQQLDKLDLLVKCKFVEMFDNISVEVKNLADVAKITGGLTKNSNRMSFELKIPYLRVANVFFNKLDLSEILEIGVRENEVEKTLLKKGDLLFVEGNGSIEQIGRVAVWDGSIEPCLHQNHLIKARFDLNVVNPIYAMYYFMSDRGRRQITGKSVSTSGLNTLSVKKIESLYFPVPQIELQNQFAAFVEQTEKTKTTISQSLEKLETLKKALMQEYFG